MGKAFRPRDQTRRASTVISSSVHELIYRHPKFESRLSTVLVKFICVEIQFYKSNSSNLYLSALA